MLQVRVFRNLSRDAWSVQARTQGAWRTVAHASAVTVQGATFYHSEAARVRCAAKHVREVHAWISGDLSAVAGCTLVAKWCTPELEAAFAAASVSSISDLPRGVSYRPFDRAGFFIRDSGESIASAPVAVCRIPAGCTVN
jgi:hypothetical protein